MNANVLSNELIKILVRKRGETEEKADTTPVTVRLDNAIVAILDLAATASGVTRAELIAACIEKNLKEVVQETVLAKDKERNEARIQWEKTQGRGVKGVRGS